MSTLENQQEFCTYVDRFEMICNHPVIEGSQYCIFHDDGPKKDAEAFQAALSDLLNRSEIWTCHGFIFPEAFPPDFFSQFRNENYQYPNMSFIDSVFACELNFNNEIFSGLTWFSDALFCKKVDFSKAFFLDSVNFEGAILSDSVFDGATFKSASFKSTTFNGLADFQNSRFLERAVFTHSNFLSDSRAYFVRSNFEDTAEFVGAEFHCDAYFGLSNFNYAHFIDTRFAKNVYFPSCVFTNYANFRSAIFSHDENPRHETSLQALFSDAIFYSEADFRGATFFGLADFKKSHFSDFLMFCPRENDQMGIYRGVFKNGLNFRSVVLGASEKVVFKRTNLSKARFLNIVFDTPIFEDVIWPSLPGKIKRKCAYDEIENAENDKSSMETLYRKIKMIYEKKADYEPAGDFHIGEMKMKKSQKGKRDFDWWLLSGYSLVSYYGERWLLPLLWMIVLFSLYAVLLMFGGFRSNDTSINYALFYGNLHVEDMFSDFFKAFRQIIEFVTFQQPQDGQQLSDASKWLSIASKLTGLALVAFFFLAIKRRFKR